jgi:hypothetical protein
MAPERIAEVFAFLDLPVLEEHLRQSVLESGRAVNVDPTRPDVAAGKWKHEWSPEDVALFEQIAGDVLLEAGYRSEPATAAPQRRAVRRPSRSVRPRADVTPHESAQRLIDRLLEGLATGDLATVTDAFVPKALVEVRGPDGWRLLGPAGVARLTSELSAEGPWGTQRTGEQDVIGTTWVVVLAHERDQVMSERLVQVTLTPELQIASLRLTRFGQSSQSTPGAT